MIILAVDLGQARTGLAVCDKTEFLASPLPQISERNMDVLSDKIAEIAKEKKVELIVLGLPKNMDGSEGESAQNARAFGKTLEEKTGLEVKIPALSTHKTQEQNKQTRHKIKTLTTTSNGH